MIKKYSIGRLVNGYRVRIMKTPNHQQNRLCNEELRSENVGLAKLLSEIVGVQTK